MYCTDKVRMSRKEEDEEEGVCTVTQEKGRGWNAFTQVRGWWLSGRKRYLAG